VRLPCRWICRIAPSIISEVAKVYAELVIRDDTGKVQGVRYEELAPMLLNEAQQQAAEIGQLKQPAATATGSTAQTASQG
jgi:hypothetical protein